ncbi:hypothetical protein ABU162_23570 [Paenibacillus thiaminolyticus]|uniref:hypothetical protein n=1 Tax=Paenibacillus thiaminolyticus TaxID=49283 RepID=UPI0035A5CF82
MKIIDVTEPFVKNYEASIAYLNDYYSKYEIDYKEYFKYHCLHVEEKKQKAIDLHPAKLQDILPMRDLFMENIPKITNAYESMFLLNPHTWLLQEGIATYLSTKIVQADLDEYFAFEEDKKWIPFAQENESKIAHKFLEDLENGIEYGPFFKEWFSINGGNHFTYMRLGYYLGYRVVVNLVERLGIEEVLTLWEKHDFKEMMKKQLQLFAT